jgi:hypothetical protein
MTLTLTAKPQLSKGNFMAKEKLVTGPRWALDTMTVWPTDCRKLTSTSTELNKWQLKKYNQFSAVIIYMSVSV